MTRTFDAGISFEASGPSSGNSPSTPSAPAQPRTLFILTSSVLNFSTNVCNSPWSSGKDARYQSQPVLNRSSDVVTYSNSGNPTLDIAIDLFAIQTSDDEAKMVQVMAALRSLLHPIQSGIEGPALCNITLGGGYAGLFDKWPCVCTHVGETFTPDAGFSATGTARVVAVHLNFLGIELDSVDAKAVSGSSSAIQYEDPGWRGKSI